MFLFLSLSSFSFSCSCTSTSIRSSGRFSKRKRQFICCWRANAAKRRRMVQFPLSFISAAVSATVQHNARLSVTRSTPLSPSFSGCKHSLPPTATTLLYGMARNGADGDPWVARESLWNRSGTALPHVFFLFLLRTLIRFVDGCSGTALKLHCWEL